MLLSHAGVVILLKLSLADGLSALLLLLCASLVSIDLHQEKIR
jgi:hypothetical protein